MIEDVFEPLALFRDRLRQEHAERVAAYFEKLVERAGVDENANRKTVGEINRLAGEIEAGTSRTNARKAFRAVLWTGFAVAVLVVGVGLLGWMDGGPPDVASGLLVLLAGLAVAGLYVFIEKKLTPRIRGLREMLEGLQREHREKLAEAWGQMQPLNGLYEESMSPRLMAETVPRLEFDPWFASGRLAELEEVFGLDEYSGADRSILFSQSGVINGNPFVVGESLGVEMVQWNYHGTLDISWLATETYTDSQGTRRTRTVVRRQTLHATVTRPKPVYGNEWFVIYGNEAAPRLRFSRVPSKYSAADSGLMQQWSRRRKLKKLEAFSRNLDDDYPFTMMSNREFELLFHAVDRSDEVEFRVLFTSLAQKQMVDLLKDTETGYGDNFSFIKSSMINIVQPRHLERDRVNAPPSAFHQYDLAAARRTFNDYQNNYFKMMYFALAPILTIPIYQQHRSHADIYRDVYAKAPSSWAHEAVANHHGEKEFAHPASITRNILKTRSSPSQDGMQRVTVAAHGFSGTDRVSYVNKWGGDGKFHRVPVHWVEYTPVTRSSQMIVREAMDLDKGSYNAKTAADARWRDFFRQWNIQPQAAAFQHSLVSFLTGRQPG